ncbi:DUF1330 domain-containing protein [Leekyejoonella antrihumi]|uniref:DUF1330 domain-containing protein n=1 Tax=Leekyejoonella antrihumi TaxID=1660198 RepID=A0A563E8U6_9MICO|nr:DUF1330 domain-containing protein [Leekyejoonella antrihumi]TWP38940.1 DUF1330 domain-containing protein [Leekyejoonella antrihumi]
MAAKGYWVGRVQVHDQDKYAKYVEASAPAYTQFGARFLVRGGSYTAVEGAAYDRNVVIEFPDYQTAMDCYQSEVYGAAKLFRQAGATADIIVVEGYDGPQPGDS